MKQVTWLSAMLLVVSTASAHAAGLSLNWDRCAADGRVTRKTSACISNLGNAGTMVASFNVPNDVLGATAIVVNMDLASAGTALPAWWTPSCRPVVFMNPTISGAASGCLDWSSGLAVGALGSFSVGAVYGPSSARLLASFAIAPPGADVRALPADGTEYFAFNTVLSNAQTTGAGACAGCTTPGCLVFNSLQLIVGSATGAIITAPQTPGSNFITWQGGTGVSSTLGGGCPAATPTRNATWGSVKALYW